MITKKLSNKKLRNSTKKFQKYENKIRKITMYKNFSNFLFEGNLKVDYSNILDLNFEEVDEKEISNFYETNKNYLPFIQNKIENFYEDNKIKSGKINVPFLNLIEKIVINFLTKSNFNKILVVFKDQIQLRFFYNYCNSKILTGWNSFIFMGKKFNLVLEDYVNSNLDYDFIAFFLVDKACYKNVYCNKLYINCLSSTHIAQKIVDYNFTKIIDKKIIRDYVIHIYIEEKTDYEIKIRKITSNIEYKNLLIICDKRRYDLIKSMFENQNISIYCQNKNQNLDNNFDAILVLTNKISYFEIKYYFFQMLINSEKQGKLCFDSKVFKSDDFINFISKYSKDKYCFKNSDNCSFSNLSLEFKNIINFSGSNKLLKYFEICNINYRYSIFNMSNLEKYIFCYIFSKFTVNLIRKMESLTITLKSFRTIVENKFLRVNFIKLKAFNVFLYKLIIFLDYEKSSKSEKIEIYNDLNIKEFINECGEKLPHENKLFKFICLSKNLFKRFNHYKFSELDLIIEYENNIGKPVTKDVVWRGVNLYISILTIFESFKNGKMSQRSVEKFRSTLSFKNISFKKT